MTGTDRTGEAQMIWMPCPRCGQRKLLCYLLTDENGSHQHTHYVCTFYGRGRRAACGWHGWTVPEPFAPADPVAESSSGGAP